LLGIEHVFHIPGAVIFGLTAGVHRKSDLQIVTVARTAQGVTISRAGNQLKNGFSDRGFVSNLDLARDDFQRIGGHGRCPRYVFAKSRKR